MTEQTNPQGRATLYKKIATVTAAVSRIPKNGENTFHRYKYATESDITDGLRDLLAENGLAFLPPSVIAWERGESTKKDGTRGDDLTRVQLQFGLACTESGEVFTAMFWGEGQDGGDKGFYKAYTGAVKYFLMKTFLIATGDDPEQDRRPAPVARQQNPRAAHEYVPAPAKPTAGPIDELKRLVATAKETNVKLPVSVAGKVPVKMSAEEIRIAILDLQMAIERELPTEDHSALMDELDKAGL